MGLLPVTFYVRSLYQKNGGFRFSQFAPENILSTSFAVLTLKMLGNFRFLTKESDQIVSFFLKNKNEDGYFVDKNFIEDNSRFHKEEYIKWQFTFFSLIALDILGKRFESLPFLDKFLTDEFDNWFSLLNFKDFWYESNRIMFLLYFLAYAQKYNPNNAAFIQQKIDQCFDFLDKNQDPSTGYWGTDRGASLSNGAFGAAHIYLFYDFFNRPLAHREQIIDSTLGLHSQNGLILSSEGGACEDYDVVEIYYRLMKVSDYKRDIISFKVSQMIKTLKHAQFWQGGYAYKYYQDFHASRGVTYKYSSWEYMETPLARPDQWATFFRTLTLIVGSRLIGHSDAGMSHYSLPGWGFVDR